MAECGGVGLCHAQGKGPEKPRQVSRGRHSGPHTKASDYRSLDRDLAERLLAAALSFVRGGAAVVAMPGPNADGQELVRSCGFEATPVSLRMVRGPALAQGVPQQVYGLANGAVG